MVTGAGTGAGGWLEAGGDSCLGGLSSSSPTSEATMLPAMASRSLPGSSTDASLFSDSDGGLSQDEGVLELSLLGRSSFSKLPFPFEPFITSFLLSSLLLFTISGSSSTSSGSTSSSSQRLFSDSPIQSFSPFLVIPFFC